MIYNNITWTSFSSVRLTFFFLVFGLDIIFGKWLDLWIYKGGGRQIVLSIYKQLVYVSNSYIFVRIHPNYICLLCDVVMQGKLHGPIRRWERAQIKDIWLYQNSCLQSINSWQNTWFCPLLPHHLSEQSDV